jgi:chaperonin cofactor prefoldin
MAFKETNSIDIKLEDQQRINNFSKMHLKYKELALELTKLDEDNKKLDDCLEELELTDESEIDFQFADCFVMTSVEKAKEITEARIKDVKAAIDQKSQQRNDLKKSLDKLKGELYAKFGNNINLDE